MGHHQTDVGTWSAPYEDKAPISVANRRPGRGFGLENPRRGWVKSRRTITIFHRIIRFHDSRGDPKGIGSGEPGRHPRRGSGECAHDRADCCAWPTADRIPTARSSHHRRAAKHLDVGYTIFGSADQKKPCKLASVEVMGERPKSPPR
jgi:hypothetical protein